MRSSSTMRSWLCCRSRPVACDAGLLGLSVDGALVTASNRACDGTSGNDPRRLAEALDGEPSVDVALFLENEDPLSPAVTATTTSSILDEYLDGRERAEAALRNPNSGEVLVSAGARLGVGGPRRPSSRSAAAATARLQRVTREVPMLTVGLGRAAGVNRREIKPLLLDHFGVATPELRDGMSEASLAGSTSSSAGAACHDERVLGAMARVPRELFVPPEWAAQGAPTTTRRCRSPFGQTISQPFMVDADVPGTRPRAVTSACSMSVRDRGTRPPCLPSWRGEVHTIERITELAGAAQETLAGAGLRARATSMSETALSACRTRRRSAAISVAAGERSFPLALWEQLERGRAGSRFRS